MARKYLKIKKLIIPALTFVLLVAAGSGCSVLTKDETEEFVREYDNIQIEVADQLIPEGDSSTEDTVEYEYVDPYIEEVLENDSLEENVPDEAVSDIIDEADYKEPDTPQPPEETPEVVEETPEVVEETPDVVEEPQEEPDKVLYFIGETDREQAKAGYEQYKGLIYSNLRDYVIITRGYAFYYKPTDDTMYIKNTVNLRTMPSTKNNDPVGSLNAGTQVHRIGVGVDEAEGWDVIEVEYTDHTVGYLWVNNGFLSATKPQLNTNTSNNTSNNDSSQTPNDNNSNNDDNDEIPDFEGNEWFAPQVNSGNFDDHSSDEGKKSDNIGLH